MIEKTPADKGKQKPPFRGVAFHAASNRIRFTDNEFIDAVFSGGYYIVLSNEEILSADALGKPHAQTKRNRRNEEILRLANQLRDITDRSKPHASIGHQQDIADAQISDVSVLRKAPTLREQLLGDLQAIINKSNFNNTEFDTHLAHELDVARRLVLNGGAMDDFALLQTLQEIAAIQGLTVVGTSMGGRFAADIMNEAEPETTSPLATPLETQDKSLLGSTPFDNDIAEYHLHDLRDYDQFSAYYIKEVGGLKHRPSFFFAKKIMTSILIMDAKEELEQNSAEIAP